MANSLLLDYFLNRRVCGVEVHAAVERHESSSSQRTFEHFIGLISAVEDFNGCAVTVVIYPFRVCHAAADTAVGCRIAQLVVFGCRKAVAVRVASGYGMNEDSALSGAFYMSSILSPGGAHQRLPS